MKKQGLEKGFRIGKLTVVQEREVRNGRRTCLVKCDCGNSEERDLKYLMRLINGERERRNIYSACSECNKKRNGKLCSDLIKKKRMLLKRILLEKRTNRYNETGTLYEAIWEEKEIFDLRNEIADKIGFYPDDEVKFSPRLFEVQGLSLGMGGGPCAKHTLLLPG